MAGVACRGGGLGSRYVGKMGDDARGRVKREEFSREGIDADLIEVPNCASQLAFIIVDQSTGERTILWQRDDRLDLRPEELQQEWIRGARLVHGDGHPGRPRAGAARRVPVGGAGGPGEPGNAPPGM